MEDGIDHVIHTMHRHGRDLSIYDESFLKRCVEKHMEKLSAKNVVDYCGLLNRDKAAAEAFAHSLHITYSRFFREPCSFAAIERRLPGLIESKADGREIRVWSAGCAYGQEAYSIAILLDEIISAAAGDMHYRIFATDISPEVLRAAETGVYRFDSIRDVRAGRLKKYFVHAGDLYRVSPLLKKNISFSVYDLLDRYSAHPAESIFGSFDIVLCSNVLLYYKSDLRLFMMEKLTRSLAGGGFLVVGEAEKGIAEKSAELAAIHTSEAVFKKANGKRTGMHHANGPRHEDRGKTG